MECQSDGKSSLWYWRQAVSAILASWVSQAKDHPWLILRGITAGWMVNWAWLFLSSVLFRESSYPKWIVGTKLEIALMLALLLVVLSVHAAIGWVVSRTSAESRKTAVIGYILTTLMFGVVQFGLQRFLFWRAGPPFEWTIFVMDIVILGGFAGVFAIAGVIATLFGGGLLKNRKAQ